MLTRLDYRAATELLSVYKKLGEPIVGLERPMINPTAFVATVSAIRFLEAISLVLENLDIEYYFIDSKQWQNRYLSSSFSGRKELKFASMMYGKTRYPQCDDLISSHGDADGLFVAQYLFDEKHF